MSAGICDTNVLLCPPLLLHHLVIFSYKDHAEKKIAFLKKCKNGSFFFVIRQRDTKKETTRRNIRLSSLRWLTLYFDIKIEEDPLNRITRILAISEISCIFQKPGCSILSEVFVCCGRKLGACSTCSKYLAPFTCPCTVDYNHIKIEIGDE